MTEGQRRPTENLRRFESEQFVESYDSGGGLTEAERLLVSRWVPPGSRILDLGVGTGRTSAALAEGALEYVGVDLSEAMVARARQRHPTLRFDVGDAARLDGFADGSFDVVVFSYNGLDYLHPVERRADALAEIRRVLAPGGITILSSHNPRAVLRTAAWEQRSGRPLRAMAITGLATSRAVWHAVRRAPFWRGHGYQEDWVQGLSTYYATPAEFVEELRRAGFDVVDRLSGNHPRGRWSPTAPWTYAAAVRRNDDSAMVEVASSPDAVRAIALEWDRLAAGSRASAFQTRSWFEAWRQCLVPDSTVMVLVAREKASGEVIGLLPLAELRRELHHRVPVALTYIGLAGSGAGAADHLGPLVRDDATAFALFDHLRLLAGRRPVLLENLQPRWSGVAATTLGARPVRSTICLAARRRPEGSFDEQWSSKMHKNVRRRARLLEDLGVTARWVAPGPDFDDALRALRDVHVRMWRSRGGDGLFDDRRERFLRRLSLRSDPELRVLLLERGEEIVGGLLGLRHGDTLSIYKTGWDPKYARVSPGIALGVEAMRWAEAQGLLVVDYLRGPRGHKVDLGCTDAEELTMIAPHGASGRALALRERLSADGVAPTPFRRLRNLGNLVSGRRPVRREPPPGRARRVGSPRLLP